eukprot:CAMPEP_0184483562 /NCGR_PEP_ID=MMETSP0113_2-20130426/5235_1 /TAXON_ID=91329 /ORGANISM="Norrisiella sphaerica, Strain BC52" /LENGTH=686 /DNA_ID=CAMNT_0026864055 /DNA_START=1859 /DNA_END=3919 /DNA_ORIENTATION=+
MHLNGNSLYCLDDGAFFEYAELVKRSFPEDTPGCGLPGPEHGYDHTLYKFRRDMPEEVKRKFVEAEYVINFGPEEYHEENVREKYPNLYLAHSKHRFFSNVFKQRLRSSWEIMRDYPRGSDYSRLELSFDDEAVLCKERRRAPVYQIDVSRREFQCKDDAGRRALATSKQECAQHCSKLEYKEMYMSWTTELGRTYEPREKWCTCFPSYCSNGTHDRGFTFYRILPTENPELCRAVDMDEKEPWVHRFPGRTYIWNTDLHAAPIGCNYDLFEAIGGVVHAEVDFPNCVHFPRTCPNSPGLKVLSHNNWGGFGLEPCPRRMRQDFMNAYWRDGIMKRVDLVICSHPIANCELYLPFNDKLLVVYATTRAEFGRWDDGVHWRKPFLHDQSFVRWLHWVENLCMIARNGGVIAANNMYDVKYLEYFTGLKVEYLPTWCGKDALYSPSRAEFLLGPYRTTLKDEGHPVTTRLLKLASEAELVVNWISEIYQHGYSFQDIASHRALIFLPYQTSTMSFFEFYRLAIPIFAPSLRLLLEWQERHHVMDETVYGHPNRPTHLAKSIYPNPNNNVPETNAVWYQWSDFYVFPHVILFDSLEELMIKLRSVDLFEVSAKMILHNADEEDHLKKRWKTVFQKAKERHSRKAKDPSARLLKLMHDSSPPDIEKWTRVAYNKSEYKIPRDNLPQCKQV